jgi:hypothetical protein
MAQVPIDHQATCHCSIHKYTLHDQDVLIKEEEKKPTQKPKTT